MNIMNRDCNRNEYYDDEDDDNDDDDYYETRVVKFSPPQKTGEKVEFFSLR